jgi:prepilin-type N-terminal cleavage/methylation domain-containing protein
MLIKTHHKNSGFTVIEVTIVLAIASLIIAVLFVAIPQARASERDSYRKAYARDVLAAAIEFYKNNKMIPHTAGDATRFITDYMPKGEDPTTGLSYRDDTTTDVNIAGVCSGIASPSQSAVYCWDNTPANINHNLVPRLGQIVMTAGLVCDNASGGTVTDPPTADSGAVVLSVVMGVEHGGFFCLSNDTN